MRIAPWFCLLMLSCASADPTADTSRVREEVFARTGLDAKLDGDGTATRELDPGIDRDALALLQHPLTADDGVRIALLNNRSVRAGLARLGIARADLVQAGLLRNPVFDGAAKFFADGGTEIDLGLAAPFLDLFHRPLRERLAEHDFAAARAMVTHELVHLGFAVRSGFVHVHATERLTVLQQQALATTVAAHELLRTLHAAGNATDQALANWRLAESAARLDHAPPEQVQLEAREPIQRLLGLWGPHTVWTLAGNLPPEPLAGLDLLEQAAHLKALAQHAGLESWRAWLPEAEAGITAMRETDGAWGLGPTVALELPLFDSGRARTDRASAALREALHQQTQLAVEVRSAARQLRDRAMALGARLQFLTTTHLPLREAAVQKVVQQYNAMQIGAFDVLQARLEQLADEREALQVHRAAWLARLDLDELLAGSLPRLVLAPTWPSFGIAGANQPAGGH